VIGSTRAARVMTRPANLSAFCTASLTGSTAPKSSARRGTRVSGSPAAASEAGANASIIANAHAVAAPGEAKTSCTASPQALR
jgi:hypothetical protein